MGQLVSFKPAGAGAAEALSRSLGEPDWLSDARRKAWELYADAPLPDRVSHLWRYTEPADFEPKSDPTWSAPATEASAAWPAALRHLLESAAAAAVALSRGGRIGRIQLDPKLSRAGVVVSDLHRAARSHSDLVRQHLGSAIAPEHGKFEALASALWRGGFFIYVPPAVQVELPLHFYTEITEGEPVAFPRLLAVLGQGAALTLVDEHAGGPAATGAAQTWGLVELVLETAASVRYIGVQRWRRGTTGFMTQRAKLARDARYLGVQASFGGSVAKYDLGALIEGTGAESQIFGVTFGEGRQHFDHHTVHDHRGAKSRSDLDVKVVLKDRARSAYTGLIRIEKDAPDSEAYQENRNLLLSEGTRAESIPELEILTDAVRCTHGATIGPLDPEHIFYLRSRGMSYAAAVRLVVGGFLDTTLQRVPADLHARLEELVLSRLKEL
jgi:Fe-S cluster assembly protein SufD